MKSDKVKRWAVKSGDDVDKSRVRAGLISSGADERNYVDY